ncbi:MAG: hypothetical protein ACI9V1_002123 [Spirosomataceae bacterium]|jgi:hypothetical protein
MKSIIKKSWLLGVVLLSVALPSCEDVTELNVDPNQPVSVPAANLLTQAEYSLYNLQQGTGLNAGWGLLMTQQWAENEYADGSRYEVDANTFNGSWGTFYTGVLNELNVARTIIEADANVPADIKTNQIAIVDIITVDAFHSVTDMWGDIPYSEALSTEFPNPKYDAQSEIYPAMLAKLDGAVASLNAASGSFSSGDIIWNGNVAAWKKTGASLLMRMAMRVSDVDAALAQQYITKAAGYGVITSNAENALFVFDSSDPQLSNPLWNNVNIANRDDFAVSDVLVEKLTAMGDPRLAVFAAETPSGTIVGMPFGLTDANAFALKSQTSRPSDMVRSAGMPHVIIDAAEVAFMTAEAIERGFLSGDAEAAYNEAVTLSMAYWGITDADALAGYLEANAYTANSWKESIGNQKWVAFYMNGLQGWAEQRRLDFPVLEVPAQAVISTLPKRLPYPISEDTNNGAALDATTSDINNITDKLWWDVN